MDRLVHAGAFTGALGRLQAQALLADPSTLVWAGSGVGAVLAPSLGWG